VEVLVRGEAEGVRGFRGLKEVRVLGKWKIMG
jgi:hypothetical protein